MEKLSFVIPCYRSENTIAKIVGEIVEYTNTLEGYDYEIILIDDYSPDNVWSVIKEMAKNDSRIKGISFCQNFGQHCALMAGYRMAKGDYVITLDDDGQTPVSQIDKMFEKIQEGYDVVYGKFRERHETIFRKFGTAVNNIMTQKIIGKPKNVHLTSFFVARGYIIREICNYDNAYPYIWGLILRTTKNIVNVEIEHGDRLEGSSGYSFSKLFGLWFNGFTAFSVKPLRASAILGLFLTIIGGLGIVFLIINKLFIDPDVSVGYTSLMCALLLIGGGMFLFLGIIGEYVGRIYMCINRKPQYVIRETTEL